MRDRFLIALLGLVVATLVAGTGCEGTAVADAGGASQQSKVRTNKSSDAGKDPVKEALLADLSRQQESRYCREMLGIDSNRPATAPDYRPEPEELCYGLWRDRVLGKELSRYSRYYR